MFFSQSEAILGRIHDHLAVWRTAGPDENLLAAMRNEFRALKSAAAAAGFDDIAELGQSVANLLAQSGAAVGSDDLGLLNLLEETHDGLAADLSFVPAASRAHVKSMNNLVALLLDDVQPTISAQSLPQDSPMGAFNEYLPQLQRSVAQVAGEHGVRIELSLSGGEFPVERLVLERMSAALECIFQHRIRHSLASDEDTVGRIDITITQSGGTQPGSELLMEYSDDGGAPDMEKLAADAVAAGMTKRADEVGEEHLLQILIRPGVGVETGTESDSETGAQSNMETVYQTVGELGGLMAAQSRRGQGMRFQFQLPVSVDAHRALLITLGQYRFAILAHTIERVLRVQAVEVAECDGCRWVSVGDRQIPLIDLPTQIGSQKIRVNDAQRAQSVAVVVIRLADRIIAVEVDRVHDIVDITRVNPGAQLVSIHALGGVAVLADSAMVLILNSAAFINRKLLERDGLTRFPLDGFAMAQMATDDAQQPLSATISTPEKTMRVVVLETSPGPLVIPAAMVAAVVSAVDWQSMEDEPAHQHEWIDRQFSWRDLQVPIIKNATAFGISHANRNDGEDSKDGKDSEEHKSAQPREYAVILWPLKNCRPDEFFALTSDCPPRVINIDDCEIDDCTPAAAPTDSEMQPNHLLGYVRIDQRIGLIPDLQTIAAKIFHGD